MESIAGLNIIVFVTLCIGAAVVTVCFSVFAWYYWTYVWPYRRFPSYRLDTCFLWKTIFRKLICPRNISVKKVVFQEIISASKQFKKEGCFVLWFFRPFVFIYNEEFNKVLYNDSAAANKSFVYKFFKPILGNGLLVSGEKTWEMHRKYLEPAFSLNQLQGLMPIFNEKAADLAKKLEKIAGLETEDLEDYIKTCIFNVMAESLLGLNVKGENCEMKMKTFMNLNDNGMKLIIKKLTRPWLYFNFIFPMLSDGRRYLEGLEDVQQFACEAAKEMKKSAHEFCKKDEATFGKILVDEHLLEDHFTAEDVRDQINNIMVAGFNPIFRCLMWCFYALGHNPKIQEKLYKEITSEVLEENITYEEIINLKFLDCVIKETMRLYSPVPIYGRKLSKKIKCEKYSLPKGAEIFFFPFMLQRNPDLFSDPEKFYPERFESDLENRPWMFIPFAEGYRNCIGKVFAQIVMKLLLVQVLRKYKIMSLSKFEESDLTWAAVLKQTKPLRVLLTIRNSDH